MRWRAKREEAEVTGAGEAWGSNRRGEGGERKENRIKGILIKCPLLSIEIDVDG